MRRSTVRPLLCLVAAAWLAGAAPAWSQQLVKTGDVQARGLTKADYPTLVQIADGVYAYSELPDGRRFTTNSVVVVTNEGVLVFDGQGNVQETQRMIDKIKTVTNQPIRYVVVGSDHGDHTGGNSAFPSTATFISHPVSKANVEQRAANTPGLPIPTELVTDKRVLMLGGKEMHILFNGPAHTGGDLQLYLPRERVLAASEVFFHQIFPTMRSASPSGWVQAIKRVQAIPADTYIPGHGFIDPPAVMRQEIAYASRAVEAIVKEATRLHHLGLPAAEALKQANWGEFGSLSFTDAGAPLAVQRVFDELDGKLTGGR